jgi:hypothetical protein
MPSFKGASGRRWNYDANKSTGVGRRLPSGTLLFLLTGTRMLYSSPICRPSTPMAEGLSKRGPDCVAP